MPPVKQSIIHFSSLISLRALTIVLPSINPLSRKDIVFSLAFPPSGSSIRHDDSRPAVAMDDEIGYRTKFAVS